MSPREQATALQLLRRWLNAIDDVERERIETETRAFLAHRKSLADEGESLIERLGWRKKPDRG